MSDSHLIPEEDLILGLSEVDKIIQTVCEKKYFLDGETTKEDMLNRVANIAEQKGIEFGYNSKRVKEAANLIRDGYFIPGGSILSGLGNDSMKCSLSNCYVTAIPNDSIEAIYDTKKRMARTYSYRGGCGVDVSVLRPANAPVNNTAKASSGAVSFMPEFSLTTGTIGQCLAYDSLVLSRDGLKEIKDIKVGDEVWTRIGWVPVIRTIKNKKNLYKLTTRYGYSVRASEDHEFQTADHEGIMMRRLKDFQINEPIVLIKGTPENDNAYQPLTHTEHFKKDLTKGVRKEVAVPEVLDERLAYLIGFSDGNGHVEVQGKATKLEVSCGTAWMDVQNKILQYASELFACEIAIRPGDGKVNRINLGNTEICEMLKENGLLKEKCADVSIPSLIYRSPVSVQCAYLAGLFDADGCNHGSKRGYVFTTISTKLAKEVHLLLMSLGVISKVQTEGREALGWNDLHSVAITGAYGQRKLVSLMRESIKVNASPYIAKRDNYLSPYTSKNLGIPAHKFSFLSGQGFMSVNGLHKTELNTDEAVLVQDRIISIELDEENADVYDLTLDAENWFFCDGLYVKNSGRRGALMQSIDCRHPDLMQFIWSKADPARVFPTDDLNTEYPSISKANISVKITDVFMRQVKDRCPRPWVAEFPVIESDEDVEVTVTWNDENMEFITKYGPKDERYELGNKYVCKAPTKEVYNQFWNGDLDVWKQFGGETEYYITYRAIVTDENRHRFIGHSVYIKTDDVESEVICEICPSQSGKDTVWWDEDTEDYKVGVDTLKAGKEYVFLNPPAYVIMENLAEAACMRGDPGVLFIDHIQNNSFSPIVHPDMRVISTNPCITGDMLVAVADGRGSVPIKQLAEEGKDVPVYCTDDNDKLVIRTMRYIRKTRENTDIVKVHLDDGTVLRSTPDHTFILNGKKEVKAKDLVPGDSLFTLDRVYASYDEIINKTENCPKNKYAWLRTTEQPSPVSEHNFMWRQANGESVEGMRGYNVHHLNGNTLDNRLENLERLTTEDHCKITCDEHMFGDNNPMRRFPEKSPFNDPEYQNWVREEFHIGTKRDLSTCKLISEKAKARCSDPSYVQAMRDRAKAFYQTDKGKQVIKSIMDKKAETIADKYNVTIYEDEDKVMTLDGKVVAMKTCPLCGEFFYVPAYNKDDRKFCSLDCSLADTNSNQHLYRDKMLASRAETGNRKKQEQLKLYTELKFNLGREPLRTEFEDYCKKNSVPGRIGGGSPNRFNTYTELQEAAGYYNCRVVKVEHQVEKEDVYNGRVDEFHNFLITDSSHPDKYRRIRNCSEIALPNAGNCLLGAHVLSKYIVDPWTSDSYFDLNLWEKNVRLATLLMNIFSDINETTHPLKEQIDTDKFSKRLGIEFLALADMLSMLGVKYGSDESIEFTDFIMQYKAFFELWESTALAEEYGACPVLDPKLNPEGVKTLTTCDYIKNVLDVNTLWESHTNVLDKGFIKPKVIDGVIGVSYPAMLTASELLNNAMVNWGLRNGALNTVGPTGSIALISGYASSGIEPIFALQQVRRTTVGEQKAYTLVHGPITKAVLEQGIGKVIDGDKVYYNVDVIKDRTNVVEAHELDYRTRIHMQRAVQKWTDGSISSTINLPAGTTPSHIVDIYTYAWECDLKGITVFVAGSMTGVLETVDKKKELEDKLPDDLSTNPEDLKEYSSKIRILGDVEPCMRHRVVWNRTKIYIIVTMDANGYPIEVFVKTPREIGEDKDGNYSEQLFQEKFSLWEAITRLVSLCLRGNLPIKDVLKQLRKSSYVMNDPMAIMIRILSMYDKESQSNAAKAKDMTEDELILSDFTSVCPECKEKTFINEGGCAMCHNPNCGYTRCN